MRVCFVEFGHWLPRTAAGDWDSGLRRDCINTWRGWCRRTAVAYLIFRGCARLSKLVTKRHFISTQDKPCRITEMSLFAQYWPVLEPEEAVPDSDTILEPKQQQYRAASEPASHTASSNSQGFSLGFDLSKSNWSVDGFRLLWMCMVCGDKPKADLPPLGCESIAQTELSVQNLHFCTKQALLPCQGRGC